MSVLMLVTVHLLSLKPQKTDASLAHLAHPIKRVQLGAIAMLNLLWSRCSRANTAIIETLQTKSRNKCKARNGFISFGAAFKRIFQAKIKYRSIFL